MYTPRRAFARVSKKQTGGRTTFKRCPHGCCYRNTIRITALLYPWQEDRVVQCFDAASSGSSTWRKSSTDSIQTALRQDISEGPIQVSESLDIDEYEEPPFSKKTRTGSSFVATEKESSESENEKASSSAKKLGKRVAKDWTDEDGEKK